MNPEDREKKARGIVQSRILTQEEHKQLKMHQLAKETGLKKDGKSKKRKSDVINVDEEER